MMTKFTYLSTAVMSVVNLLVLLSVLSLDDMQLAGLNTAVLAVLAAVGSWFDNNVPWYGSTE